MKLLVTDELSQEGLEMLTKDSGVQVDVKPKLPHEELLRIIGEYDGLIVRSGTKVTAEVIEAGKKLKRVVGRVGVGVDNNVDVDAATRRGVLVMNTPAANIISAAEHTMAMMLTLAEHTRADASVKAGKWEGQVHRRGADGQDPGHRRHRPRRRGGVAKKTKSFR